MVLQDNDNFVISDTSGTNHKVTAIALSNYVNTNNADGSGGPTSPWEKSGTNVTLVSASDLVGVGGDAQSGYKMKVHGSFLATGDVSAFSDESLKDDVQVIDGALYKLLQVRGVTFVRNDVEDSSRKAGVIAQEVEKVLPEVVITSKDGLKSVAYGNLVALLIEAIKELKSEIEELKSK